MKTINKANPNRHGFVRLLQDEDGNFIVTTPWNENGEDFFDDEDGAKKFYEETVDELNGTPNWEAQAEYDEANGTDNGFAPWQFLSEY